MGDEPPFNSGSDSNPMPDPDLWPECSDCHTAYVLRRGLSFSLGWKWVWQQDCKHGRKGSPQPDAVIARRAESDSEGVSDRA